MALSIESSRLVDTLFPRSVYILCQRDSRGILNVALSIDSLMLVETLLPIAELIFLSGFVGILVKSL